MYKNKVKIIKGVMVISLLMIIILVITLMALWSSYVEQQKQATSSVIISIIKLSISNSDKNDIDNTCSSIVSYINKIPNRKIAIYDEYYNLREVYPNQPENFDIKNYPNLFNLLKSSKSGHELISINNHDEEIFWNWVVTKNGSRKLLIVYDMHLDPINEFSFVFIISYLIIVFILILITSIYLNGKHEYFISLTRLYQLSLTSYDN